VPLTLCLGVVAQPDAPVANHTHAGHWITAAGHLITAIIGAGVLGLPSSLAWLGWIGGIIALVFFYAVSLWAAIMLTEVYCVNGRRHTRYKFAVYWILGPKHSFILSLAQHANFVLTTIGYQIAGADSMRCAALPRCQRPLKRSSHIDVPRSLACCCCP
jgi:Transmembrane amino acid transporter protein